MQGTASALDLTYPAVLDLISKYLVAGRDDSRAFLMWFLENYYRLDEFDVQEYVCDGFDDKGVDGVYVDDNLEQVDVLQSKLFQNNDKTIGDVLLKEFVGTLAQFRDVNAVTHLIATTSNKELSGLLRDKKVADKIEEGYTVRGVLVTNTVKHEMGNQYLANRPDLVVYDSIELGRLYVPQQATGPVTQDVSFNLPNFGHIQYTNSQSGATVFIAPLAVKELLQMQGISNQYLFDWNVRKSLGRTKVNKEIEQSIDNVTEHPNFLLYHNGLTILAESVTLDGTKLTISGYSVVNGCQSITSFYNHQGKVSDELRVLTRVIRVSPESDLAAKITRRTNNQNGITPRDLQSNSVIQSRLQNEFTASYPDVFYRIKRGEESSAARIIENEMAARILLAFDLRQPWTCHQTYKLFDELHADIFGRPEVNASRILALYSIYEVIERIKPKIKDQRFANYSITPFFSPLFSP